MIAYEFYWRDAAEEYHHIGTLPERRINPVRISEESVMNWARELLGDSVDFDNLLFIPMAIDRSEGNIFPIRERGNGWWLVRLVVTTIHL
jgi:hypothetical protein